MLKKIRKSQNAFAYTLLAPSIILLVALIGYPMIYNIMISVQKVPLLSLIHISEPTRP